MYQPFMFSGESDHCLKDGAAIKKILYATDLSQDAPKVFHYVLTLASQFGADVTSLHVVDNYSDQAKLTLAAYISKEKRYEMTTHTLQDAMDEMMFRDREMFKRMNMGQANGSAIDIQGIKSTNKVVMGNIEEQILFQAEKIGVDCIVMGSNSKKRPHTKSGTIGKRVLRRSQVPVIIVPLPA